MVLYCIRLKVTHSTLQYKRKSFLSFQVSWIRKGRHPIVLSSGEHSFTSNHRVEIKTFPDKWVLKIEPVLEKDDGYYECQVNTRETMSLVFKLNVERKFNSYLI